MEQENSDKLIVSGTSLAGIRKRRWFLWGLILVYLPGAAIMLQLTQSVTSMGIIFSCWLVLLCVAVGLMASSKCPGCGKPFHMRNSTLSFSRKCCHCGLHVCDEG